MKTEITLFILLVLASACVGQTQEKQAQPQDFGDFKVVFAPAENQNLQEIGQAWKESGNFQLISDSLNEFVALPRDVEITFAECGTVNAFYDPSESRIIICYEIMDYFRQLFYNVTATDEELINATDGAIYFVFYHEMGHALADVLQLPITGKEEDAADQLAIWILLDASDAGENAAISGASWFLLEAQRIDIEQLPFWDEHSLDAQRFYNILCWIYGKDPQKYYYLVEDGYLPEDRAIKCEAEYQKMHNSWYSMLYPYLKA